MTLIFVYYTKHCQVSEDILLDKLYSGKNQGNELRKENSWVTVNPHTTSFNTINSQQLPATFPQIRKSPSCVIITFLKHLYNIFHTRYWTVCMYICTHCIWLEPFHLNMNIIGNHKLFYCCYWNKNVNGSDKNAQIAISLTGFFHASSEYCNDSHQFQHSRTANDS